MAKERISLKQLAIDKDNTAIVVTVGLAAFVIVFCLVASYALLDQRAYQAKVIGKKKDALSQLRVNVEEVDKLKASYQAFAEEQENVLGGSANGKGERDGQNPRLILDALPSKYDFPALTTSLEKLFSRYSIESIDGTDDEIAQAEAETSTDPIPVEMPFSITLNGTTQTSKEILQLFERSIRPIQIRSVVISGQSNQLNMSIQAETYFQPEKRFDVREETVR